MYSPCFKHPNVCLYTLLSSQFGVVLVTASIVDTFFVRAVLVPALLFMAAESNWWPGKMPPVIIEDAPR
jgi:uncharacterized membrane protein YdfJ with MMPL/SSD domain